MPQDRKLPSLLPWQHAERDSCSTPGAAAAFDVANPKEPKPPPKGSKKPPQPHLAAQCGFPSRAEAEWALCHVEPKLYNPNPNPSPNPNPNPNPNQAAAAMRPWRGGRAAANPNPKPEPYP